MDPDLKQRLVGAVVITSLAAIFVPMLFDDPVDESGKMISELKIPDAPVKSVDIDSVTLPATMDEVISLPEAEAVEEEMVSHPSDSNLARWFLQVGTFGEKDNAVSLQNILRKQGFPASINIMSEDSGVLYKVRVGPELDKKRVEAMKTKIDKLNNLDSIVISVDE